MKRACTDHPKLYQLAEILGIEIWAATGLLERMWHVTARTTPRGDIGSHTNASLARLMGVSSIDPDALVSALVESKWLDECKNHRLVVHDWHEHADQSLKRSVVRQFGGFIVPESPSAKIVTSVPSDSHIGSGGSRVDSLPEPVASSQKPEPEARSQPGPGGRISGVDRFLARNGADAGGLPMPSRDEFAELVDLHPRPREKSRAIDAARVRWREIAGGIEPPDPIPDDPLAYLRDRMAAYAASEEGSSRFAKGPVGWFEGRMDLDDDAAWKRADDRPERKEIKWA